MFERDLICDIGECRCAFVGGDHEVRVVTVVPNDIGGRLDPAVDQVVGDREQARDESPVAGDPFGARFLGGGRRPEDHEPALGADRHDDRVLHRLGFNQPEHLGPVVFAPVRPAETAAGDAAEAQVYPFDARRANEEFGVRARLRQRWQRLCVDLQHHYRRVGVGPVVARAQRRGDQIQEAAQDAVLVQCGDLVQTRQGAVGQLGHPLGSGRLSAAPSAGSKRASKSSTSRPASEAWATRHEAT